MRIREIERKQQLLEKNLYRNQGLQQLQDEESTSNESVQQDQTPPRAPMPEAVISVEGLDATKSHRTLRIEQTPLFQTPRHKVTQTMKHA